MSQASPVRRGALDRLLESFQPAAAHGERLTVQLVLTGAASEGAIWLDIRDGQLEVGEGSRSAADLTFELSCDDLNGVLDGTVNPDLLFMQERLRVDGPLSLALSLRKMFRARA